jgi:hypothetical protein
MLYSIRSERLLMEEIDYNILFRWFVGLNLDEEVWDATTFIFLWVPPNGCPKPGKQLGRLAFSLRSCRARCTGCRYPLD